MNKLVRLAAPIAALALMAGCAKSPDVAFSVNGEATRMSAITQAAKACAQSGPGSELTMTALLLEGAIADQVISTSSMVISNSEADAVLLNTAGYNPEKFSAECWSHLRGAARYAIGIGRIGEQAWRENLKGIDVVVNPVFGSVNPETKMLTGRSSSLSVPGPTYGQPQARGK